MTDLKSVSIWNNINLLLRSHFKRLRIFLIRERVRVSCGHLCEAEAPTEAAAETVSVEWLTEGEKIIRLTLLRNNPSVIASHDTSPYTGEAMVCISNIYRLNLTSKSGW